MKFSQRLGITDVRSAIQVRSLDRATRNRLWSAFALNVPHATHGWVWEIYIHVWVNFFKRAVDDLPQGDATVRNQLRTCFLTGQWHQVYDLIEFLINSMAFSENPRTAFHEGVTEILAQELAGARIIEGRFVEITDETEIAAIETAFEATAADEFSPSRAHLTTALDLFADREAPDYRNSIKESISAVEAVIQTLTGDSKADFAKGLKLLEKRTPLHGALRSALKSLYGYTSDADGIRHPLTEESNADGATAKFMLVICSAFVSYLIQVGGATS